MAFLFGMEIDSPGAKKSGFSREKEIKYLEEGVFWAQHNEGLEN